MKSETPKHGNDIIGLFAHHRVAANLLMVIMFIAGAVALNKMNVQFFPNLDFDVVSVRVAWPGATAEDTRTGITIPLEQRLKNLDGIRTITSTSAEGLSAITMEFESGTDMITAVDQTKTEVDGFTAMPTDAEIPVVARAMRYERVANVVITGTHDLASLRLLANQFKNELLSRGINKIDMHGLPEEEITIEVSQAKLLELGMDFNQVAAKLREMSVDLPAGSVGQNSATQEIRVVERRETGIEFDEVILRNDSQGIVRLQDVASVKRVPKEGEVDYQYKGDQAVEMLLRRSANGDSLVSARILDQWLKDTRPTLPDNIELVVYNERWKLIKQRISILVWNGTFGLLLVIGILFVFLPIRVAWWVTIGIATSFSAALFVLYLMGGSINMVSLFALIMALGIIVDDAIVVGEEADAQHDRGRAPLLAAEYAAKRMIAPVTAAMLTTIAAFIPLLMVGGFMGKVIVAIPMVIIAVIIASMIESFLILPGHLRHSFVAAEKSNQESRLNRLRKNLDNSFDNFRDNVYRPFVERAIDWKWVIIATVLGLFVITLAMRVTFLKFTFFPSPPAQLISANAVFVTGTPEKTVTDFLMQVEDALYKTEAEFGEALIQVALLKKGITSGRSNQGGGLRGDHLGSLYVSLIENDLRPHISNKEFIKRWRAKIDVPAGMDNFTLTARKVGPSGRDVSVQLSGDSPELLKTAALELAEGLKGIQGVSQVIDDMPYGKDQLIFSLSGEGIASGLSTQTVARQIQASFMGRKVQTFQDGDDEVEVWVRLPLSERGEVDMLERTLVRLPTGEYAPLSNLVIWRTGQGFDAMRHYQGNLTIEVFGSIDKKLNTEEDVAAVVESDLMPAIVEKYRVQATLSGQAENKRETMADIKFGVIVGLVLIYIILAWVFASYSWPIVIILTIPFGVIGAFWGHLIMGINLTMLSIFGIIGLSGIVINDSIILVTFYRDLRAKGMALREAIVEASCSRLRAVILTSLTTIAGLFPLLFETSRQAQFLIPMATSMAFGLLFATVLILLFVPAQLYVLESLRDWLKRLYGQAETDRQTNLS